MKTLTRKQLFNAMQHYNGYLALRSIYGSVHGVNVMVGRFAAKRQPINDSETGYIGFCPINFQETLTIEDKKNG